MKCLILCGGKSSRMKLPIPKVLLPLNGDSSLGFNVKYWQQYGIDRFVFLTGHYYQYVERYIKTLPIEHKKIIRGEGNVSWALDILKTEKKMGDKFIITLGDCLLFGKFDESVINNNRFSLGVVSESDEIIKSNYAVIVESGKVEKLLEHPKEVPSNSLCGMGTFILGKEIFDAIRETKISEVSGKVEFIDAVQLLIDKGLEVKPLSFDGLYLNINKQDDFEQAKKLCKEYHK